MFDSSIIEVAIGLIFVFSLLAILVTQINAVIANLLKWRSKQLKEGLIRLVSDKRLQAEVLAHPLINMVQTPGISLMSVQFAQSMDTATSYALAEEIVNAETTDVTEIAPSTFVDALTSILIARSDYDLYRPVRDAIEAMTSIEAKSLLREAHAALQQEFSEKRLRNLEQVIRAIPDNGDLLTAFSRTESALTGLRYRTSSVIPLLNGISKIDNPAFREALEKIVATSRSLEEARDRLAQWYDDGMNRISAVYRSKIQIVSFIVAFIVVVILNVDTLFLARSLWEDADLRQALAETAREFDTAAALALVQTETGDIENPGDVLEPDVLPPDAGEAVPDTAPGDVDSGVEVDLEDIVAQSQEVGQTIQTLLELQLPIGWEFTPVSEELVATATVLGLPDPRNNTRNVWNYWPGNGTNWFGLIISKIIGLLATTIAVAQGAPFWFDLLNRIANPRRSSNA